MSILNNNSLVGASGQGGGYNLTNSLRFRSSASANLSRTNTATGDAQKFTWSGWVKRGSISSAADQFLFCSDNFNTSSNRFIFQIILKLGGGAEADTLVVGLENSVSGTDGNRRTTQVFRDPSAWYHIVGAVDTTQATASNRIKVYVNGVEVTSFAVSTNPNQNANVSINQNGGTPRIGAFLLNNSPQRFFDGYMTEVNFIDGQALTPSSFGETSPTTGVWQPKRYAGTYGTNGFYLPFTDNSALTTSSNVGLGKDFSGNGNYWTTNNISITSGSTYDSMTDVPTLTSATASNFATLNPLDKGSSANPSIQAGNLNIVGADSSFDGVRSTIAMTSGKWYWEAKIVAIGGQTRTGVGIYKDTDNLVGDYGNGTLVVYDYLGTIYINNESGSGSSTYYSTSGSISAGDVFGFAFDADTGKVYISKNGTYFNSGVPASGTGNVATLTTGIPYFAGGWAFNSSDTVSFTFGQQPFAYTPPTGYVALNTFNLPTPTIGATASSQANKYMNIVLYTGDNSSSPRSITGFGFSPDFVWVKARSNTIDHNLWNNVMGAGASQGLHSNSTAAAGDSGNFATYGYVSSLDSDGFTVTKGSDATYGNFWHNYTSTPYVAWGWDANGTGVTNTAGSITSTVSANTTSGFSVVTFSTNASSGGATIGHGLGVAPKMIIMKARNQTYSWDVYHASLGASYRLILNSSGASQGPSSDYWNSTSPTSSVFSINQAFYGTGVNTVAYCFAEVAGYSKIGSFVGNGSTDGPFVYCGFRPKYIMSKSTSGPRFWFVTDTSRDPYNVCNLPLFPNDSQGETAGTTDFDILSNGFKARTTNAAVNGNGETIIYMAFAENPFKYSLAR